MNARRTTLLTAVALLAACGGNAPSSITGLVDATEIDVASRIPGRVTALAVREGDAVAEGQPLVTIESQELEARLDQLGGTVAAARAKLKLARNGARPEEKAQAEQSLNAARHQVEITRKALDRAAALIQSGTITQAAYDEAEFRSRTAQDQLAIAQARLDLVQNGARAEELEGLEALVRQGEGGLAEVRSYARETTQAAPLAGEVAKIHVRRGELAATGYPILTLVDRRDSWVTFSVREDLLAGLQVGASIQVEIPALRRSVPMVVFQVASLGDFATWRATGEKGRFDLRTFEVKARPAEPVADLRPGMTARFVPPRAPVTRG